MPIDAKDLRDHPEIYRESQRRRFRGEALVDSALEIDSRWRAEVHQVEALKCELGKLQASISHRKKESKGKDPCTDDIAAKERLDGEIAEHEDRLRSLATERSDAIAAIGNVLADGVPVAPGEDGNLTLRSWGRPSRSRGLQHFELLGRLAICDSERGTRVAGRRGYFLRGTGVLLNMALQNYAISFLAQRGYTALQPPFFMHSDVMAKTAELADFDEQLYRVSHGRQSSASTQTTSYLIATAEQPISALHQGETFKPEDLPLRYAGISPCFRAESGSHGVDAKGLFRVHQFEKVEQFCLCTPEDSQAFLDEMLELVEEFYQSLDVPYRVVAIASGALNSAAAMKYDVEAWFPGSQEYRELVSCSNCTDFQSRALNVRVGKRFVHMLNATLCATERTICCLLETFQCEDGVRVPRALVPYMHGQELIRFPKEGSNA